MSKLNIENEKQVTHNQLLMAKKDEITPWTKQSVVSDGNPIADDKLKKKSDNDM